MHRRNPGAEDAVDGETEEREKPILSPAKWTMCKEHGSDAQTTFLVRLDYFKSSGLTGYFP